MEMESPHQLFGLLQVNLGNQPVKPESLPALRHNHARRELQRLFPARLSVAGMLFAAQVSRLCLSRALWVRAALNRYGFRLKTVRISPKRDVARAAVGAKDRKATALKCFAHGCTETCRIIRRAAALGC